MTDPYIEKVQAFHCKHIRPVSNVPVVPDDREIDKQIRYMHTAMAELCFAMKEDKMLNVARGLAHLLYTVFGTAIIYGIPMHSTFSEWHIGEMGEGPPQIKELLKRHGWKGKN